MTKGSKSASEYLHKIKVIVNTLISIGDPVSFRDHLEIIFDGLPEEFDALMTLVYNRGTLCSINEVEAMIVCYEARLDRTRKKQLGESLISANVAQVVAPANSSTMTPPPVPNYQPPAPTPHESSYGRDFNEDSYQSENFGGRGNREGRGRGRGRGRGGRSSVQCQICHKSGHDASICYHRYNNAPQTQNSPHNS